MQKEKLLQLLSTLTLEEKIAQLNELGGMFFTGDDVKTGPMAEFGLDPKLLSYVGSTLNVIGAKKCLEIQEKHLQLCPKKIPLLFMGDIIFGYKTIFPIPLAIAGTFNPALFYLFAKTQAKEASISGLHLTFFPMLDLVRDPRWGRVMESFGEDSYLGCVFAKQVVNGMQQHNLAKKYTIASCVKHFVGYGAVEGGREYNTTTIPLRILHQTYLPPFKEAIKQGAKMVMPAFSTFDLIPATCNTYLLNDILRKKWKFDYPIVSDHSAIKELIPHGVAQNETEAAIKALSAGVDIDMMSGIYQRNLLVAIKNNLIDETLLDKAVFRILNLKNELGLFENPYRFTNIEEEGKYQKEYQKAAYKVASESLVLLKNNQDILPFKKQERVLFAGPYLDSKDLNGTWAMFADRQTNQTIKDALIALKIKSVFPNSNDIDELITLAATVDKVCLFLGESFKHSGEDKSRVNINLPKEQIVLLKTIKAINPNLVIVLLNGRPLVLREIVEECVGIIEAWLPGCMGGRVIADTLYGITNPSGKLTISFPRHVGQIPIYYNNFNTGRPYIKGVREEYTSRYRDCENSPLFAFGHGLSYTTFAYENLTLNTNELIGKEKLIITLDIKNNGLVDGTEVVQLYIQDLYASVTRPLKELKAFQKIKLQSKEKKTITFILDYQALKFFNANMHYDTENGLFNLLIGSASDDIRFKIEFRYSKFAS